MHLFNILRGDAQYIKMAHLLTRLTERQFLEAIDNLVEQGLVKKSKSREDAISLTEKGLKYINKMGEEKRELFVLFNLYWSVVTQKLGMQPLGIIKK